SASFCDAAAATAIYTLSLHDRSSDLWRSDELIARYNDEEDVRDLIDLALQLEDLTRNAGKHAGGVVIAPTPLSDFCPLFAEHDRSEEHTSELQLRENLVCRLLLEKKK